MRLAVIAVLAVVSLLFAETQADVYYRAMLAEEQGDISAALQLFEQAVEMDGEYTEEIREIINEYNEALDMAGDESPWSFRVLGEAYYGHRFYSETGGYADVDENAGDVSASLSVFLDYSMGNWIHSVGVSYAGDWFVANEGVVVLDTNDWIMAPGLEYSLVGRNVLLDVGVDFNKPNKSGLELSLYGWLELDFVRWEKQRAGMSLWGYNRDGNSSSFALYASWHRMVPTGLNGSLFVGARYEADSLADILGYLKRVNAVESQQESMYNGNPWQASQQLNDFGYYMDLCLQEYGDACYDPANGLVELLMWQEEVSAEYEDVVLESYWTRWVGPSLRSRVSYRFRTKISLEAKLNLFYGFVVDGASDVYEDLTRFSGTWGAVISWNPNFMTLYFGVEQMYVRYNVPADLDDYYPDNTSRIELKGGLKFEF